MSLFSFLFDSSLKQISSKKYNHLFSRELLIDIINASDKMNMIFSKDDGWIGANQKFFDTLGYQDIDDFRTKQESVRDLFISESEEIFTEDDKSWLDYVKKHKTDGYKVKLYNKKDEILDMSLKAIVSKSEEGVYILEFEDISKLELAKIQINTIEELKTKFLSNIGHEFRTPMNGVIGFVELLSHTKLDKKQSEYLHLIETSSKNLMSNIETLLDLSQVQGGRLSLDNEKLDLAAHMEELVYQHTSAAKDKGVKLLSFIDPKLPKEIEADIRKIKQIVNALVQNAIKFTPRRGRVVLEVKLLKRQANGNCSIGFGVKDNGIGISQDKIANITEPFQSGDQADGRLGIGLSLAHGLVKLFGSELRIQSKEEEGSSFNFVLDFTATKGQAYKMSPKKKVKVLLLDNTKIDEANILSSYLRSFSIDVVKAKGLDENIYNGVKAVYVLANQSDSSWMLELGRYGKKAPVIILLDEGEKLQAKLTYVTDAVLSMPLFPSKISKHLMSINGTASKEKEEKEFKIKGKVNILVVEDNLINQKLIEIMLKAYNVNVLSASNGNEAIEICAREAFDIVFMDIDMPEKNGIIATKEIKETIDLNGTTPIVALTAMAMQGDREMLLSEGLDDYLSKPITKVKLEGILNKYL